MMRVLNFTAELEVRRHGPLDCGEYWCVIKVNDYEIGRVEMSRCRPHEEAETLETAAAIWLSDRLKS